jgi:hypothetical protein
MEDIAAIEGGVVEKGWRTMGGFSVGQLGSRRK